jgi:hypothetical protein
VEVVVDDVMKLRFPVTVFVVQQQQNPGQPPQTQSGPPDE